MTLKEIFSDPLEPNRSLQLNNRYWPGERFTLLNLISDTEALVNSRGINAATTQLRQLKRFFASEHLFARFLRRLHRLQLYRSEFGYTSGRVDLGEATIQANRYSGTETRASYPLAQRDGFAHLIKETVRVYTTEYGSDLVKVHCTVRFAKPDGRLHDVTDFGPLSDYHNDEYKGISTIVYLSDVREENGAFSFISGSNLIPRSLVLSAIHQCVAFDMRLELGRTSPEEFASVPLEFRGSPGLGNFLDEEKVALVQPFIEVLEGGAGSFVTFNGQYLMHRGGKPLTGARTAAFVQPEGVFRHKLRSLGSLFYAFANK